MDHAKYSASGSHRWLKCPGSIKLCADIPPTTSVYADEGTKAHTILDFIMKGFIKNGHPRIAAAALAQEAPKRMIDHALGVCERVKERLTPGAFVLSDIKVEVPEVGFGTLDIAIVEEFGRLTVIDYKYGKGVAVEATENSQMLYYAIGLAHQYGKVFEEVTLVIDQPRAFHPSGMVREWTAPAEVLVDWHEKLKTGVQLAERAKPELLAGSHCMFCPGSFICPEIKNKKLREAQEDFA